MALGRPAVRWAAVLAVSAGVVVAVALWTRHRRRRRPRSSSSSSSSSSSRISKISAAEQPPPAAPVPREPASRARSGVRARDRARGAAGVFPTASVPSRGAPESREPTAAGESDVAAAPTTTTAAATAAAAEAEAKDDAGGEVRAAEPPLEAGVFDRSPSAPESREPTAAGESDVAAAPTTTTTAAAAAAAAAAEAKDDAGGEVRVAEPPLEAGVFDRSPSAPESREPTAAGESVGAVEAEDDTGAGGERTAEPPPFETSDPAAVGEKGPPNDSAPTVAAAAGAVAPSPNAAAPAGDGGVDSQADDGSGGDKTAEPPLVAFSGASESNEPVAGDADQRTAAESCAPAVGDARDESAPATAEADDDDDTDAAEPLYEAWKGTALQSRAARDLACHVRDDLRARARARLSRAVCKRLRVDTAAALRAAAAASVSDNAGDERTADSQPDGVMIIDAVDEPVAPQLRVDTAAPATVTDNAGDERTADSQPDGVMIIDAVDEPVAPQLRVDTAAPATVTDNVGDEGTADSQPDDVMIIDAVDNPVEPQLRVDTAAPATARDDVGDERAADSQPDGVMIIDAVDKPVAPLEPIAAASSSGDRGDDTADHPSVDDDTASASGPERAGSCDSSEFPIVQPRKRVSFQDAARRVITQQRASDDNSDEKWRKRLSFGTVVSSVLARQRRDRREREARDEARGAEEAAAIAAAEAEDHRLAAEEDAERQRVTARLLGSDAAGEGAATTTLRRRVSGPACFGRSKSACTLEVLLEEEEEEEDEEDEDEEEEEEEEEEKKEERQGEHCARIAAELLDTERSYVAHLQRIVEEYLAPLREVGDEVITADELAGIFANVERLATVHMDLLTVVEARVLEWGATQRLGDIFEHFGPLLHGPYCEYVLNFSDSAAMLGRLERERAPLATFLADARRRTGQTLPSLLIMPVQRIPRYVLLLEDMMRRIPLGHPDVESLCTGLSTLRELTASINEAVHEAEVLDRVIGVQRALVGLAQNLVVPGRRLIRSGPISAVERGAVRRRHGFLFNDIFIVAKAESRKQDRFRVKEVIPFGGVYARRLSREDELAKLPSGARHVFQLAMPTVGDRRLFALPDAEQADSWHASVSEAAVERLMAGSSGGGDRLAQLRSTRPRSGSVDPAWRQRMRRSKSVVMVMRHADDVP